MTHGSYEISDSVWEAFTAETGITVELLSSGDAGEMVSRGDPDPRTARSPT